MRDLQPILVLWDGDCGWCSRIAAWLQSKDRRGLLQLQAYQSAPSPPMTPSLAVACEKAVHVVHADGRIERAGLAALSVLERIGWRVFARLLRLPPPVWLVEAAYFVVSRNRPFFARFTFRAKALPVSDGRD